MWLQPTTDKCFCFCRLNIERLWHVSWSDHLTRQPYCSYPAIQGVLLELVLDRVATWGVTLFAWQQRCPTESQLCNLQLHTVGKRTALNPEVDGTAAVTPGASVVHPITVWIFTEEMTDWTQENWLNNLLLKNCLAVPENLKCDITYVINFKRGICSAGCL